MNRRNRNHRAWVGLLLGLGLMASCAPDPGRALVPTGSDPTDPRVAACQREAEAAPAVREIAMRRPTIPSAQQQRERDLRSTVAAEMDRCLRREGLRPRGGVERVVRP